MSCCCSFESLSGKCLHCLGLLVQMYLCTALLTKSQTFKARCNVLVRPHLEYWVQLPRTRKIRSCWAESNEEHEDDEGTGTSPLWGKAERVETVQSKEEKAQRGCYQHFNISTFGYKFPKRNCWDDGDRLLVMVPSDKARNNGHKLEHIKFHLSVRKRFAVELTKNQCRLRRLWTPQPERWWIFPPWSFSKLGCG